MKCFDFKINKNKQRFGIHFHNQIIDLHYYNQKIPKDHIKTWHNVKLCAKFGQSAPKIFCPNY